MKTNTALKIGDEVLVNDGTRRVAVRRLQANGIVELAEPVEDQLFWPSAMLTKVDLTLGDMLAEAIEQSRPPQRISSTPSEARRRRERQEHLQKAAEIIETEIRAGRIPRVPIDDKGLEDWILSCRHHQRRTVDYDLYEVFERRFAAQGIAVNKDVRSLTVEPIGAAA